MANAVLVVMAKCKLEAVVRGQVPMLRAGAMLRGKTRAAEGRRVEMAVESCGAAVLRHGQVGDAGTSTYTVVGGGPSRRIPGPVFAQEEEGDNVSDGFPTEAIDPSIMRNRLVWRPRTGHRRRGTDCLASWRQKMAWREGVCDLGRWLVGEGEYRQLVCRNSSPK